LQPKSLNLDESQKKKKPEIAPFHYLDMNEIMDIFRQASALGLISLFYWKTIPQNMRQTTLPRDKIRFET